MLLQRDQPQQTSLEILSLTIGIMLGGLAAILLIAFILLTGLGPGFAVVPNIATLLPAHWQAGLLQTIQAMGFPLQQETPAYWYMSRVSAVLGYALLWGSTLWGLLLSTKILKKKLSPALAFGVHEFLSLLGLGFAVFHPLILLGDRYIAFGLGDILLPFSASFEPFWVGIGTISLYLYALIVASFYFRKRIGQKAWRTMHYLTFGLYLMVTAHSLLIGTDSSLTAMQAMYLSSAASILFLAYYRILDGSVSAKAK